MDAISVSLGALFRAQDKLILERFAKQAFGGFVQFAEGHSVIELFPTADLTPLLMLRSKSDGLTLVRL